MWWVIFFKKRYFNWIEVKIFLIINFISFVFVWLGIVLEIVGFWGVCFWWFLSIFFNKLFNFLLSGYLLVNLKKSLGLMIKLSYFWVLKFFFIFKGIICFFKWKVYFVFENRKIFKYIFVKIYWYLLFILKSLKMFRF